MPEPIFMKLDMYSCYYQITGNLHVVYGCSSLSLDTSKCFPQKGLLGCGLVRSIIKGHCLFTFSLECPAKYIYCESSLFSWTILVLKYRCNFNYSSVKNQKGYTMFTMCPNPITIWLQNFNFMDIIIHGHKYPKSVFIGIWDITKFKH
jgi:hypothetical protein